MLVGLLSYLVTTIIYGWLFGSQMYTVQHPVQLKQTKNNHLTCEEPRVTFLRDRRGRLFVSHLGALFLSLLFNAVGPIEHSSSTENDISIACAVDQILTTKRLSERCLYVVCIRVVCVGNSFVCCNAFHGARITYVGRGTVKSGI